MSAATWRSTVLGGLLFVLLGSVAVYVLHEQIFYTRAAALYSAWPPPRWIRPVDSSIDAVSDSFKDPPQPDLLVLNVWTGIDIPAYLTQVLDHVAQSPALSMLLIATGDSHQLCPGHGQLSAWETFSDNIHIHCVTRQEMYELLADGMCQGWQCEMPQQMRVRRAVRQVLERNPYRMNDMKPIYPAAFGHLFQQAFPNKCFSHWIRLDLDVVIGNFQALFPWELLDHDIVTFSPKLDKDARELVIRGYLTALRLSPKVNDLWMRMPKFTDAEQFIVASRLSGFKSIDEGLFSKIVIESSDVSFIIVPGLVTNDDDLKRAPSHKFVVSGDSAEVLLAEKTSRFDRHESILLPARSDMTDRRPRHILSGSRTLMQNVPLSTNCTFLYWIPREDWLCIDTAEEYLPAHVNTGIAVYRAPDSDNIVATEVQDPGSLGLGSEVRRQLAMHYLYSKVDAPDSFFGGRQGRILQPGQRQEVWYDARHEQYRSDFHRLDKQSGSWSRLQTLEGFSIEQHVDQK